MTTMRTARIRKSVKPVYDALEALGFKCLVLVGLEVTGLTFTGAGLAFTGGLGVSGSTLWGAAIFGAASFLNSSKGVSIGSVFGGMLSEMGFSISIGGA